MARLRSRLSSGEGLLVLAALTGLGAGLAAVFLEWSTHRLEHLFFGGSILTAATWRIVLIPVAGNVAVATLLRFLAPTTLRNGVAQVILALRKKAGRIPLMSSIVAILAPALSIGTGGSVGPEGPIVHAGAGIGSVLGQGLRLPPHTLRLLAGCGVAGGIAGIFNAPIAGVLFAAEVVLGHFAVGTLMPLLIAAVVAAATARSFVGAGPTFPTPSYEVNSLQEIPVYVILGLATGLVSAFFIRAVAVGEQLFEHLRPHWILRAVLGGLLLAGVGLVLPEVLGSGYNTAAAAIDGRLLRTRPALLLTMIALVKVVMTSITLASGGTGGVFAPSLVVGSTLGAAVGVLGRDVLGAQIGPPGSFALVGMAGIIAGSMRSPVGGMMIVVEMTGNYLLILPLMLVSALSTFLASRLEEESLYTDKLARMNVRFRPAVDPEYLARIGVADVLEPTPTVSESAPLATVVALLRTSQAPAVAVLDGDDKFIGLIRPIDVGPEMAEPLTVPGLILAADVVVPESYAAGLDEDLALVYAELSLSDMGAVPVVDAAGRFLGIVRHSSLMRRYRQMVLRPHRHA